MVTASGAGRTIYEQGYRYIFGIMSPAGGYLRGSIDVAILQEPKPATTVILSCNDAAALEDAQDTAQYARAKGLKMSSPSPEELPPGFHVEAGIVVYTHNAVEDFRPIMRTLKTLRPDFFIGTGHLTESENIVQAAAEVDFKPMGLTFSVGPSLPAFYNTLGELAQSLHDQYHDAYNQILGVLNDVTVTQAALTLTGK
jgi:branched-chain amino acid transport system substrate-binding protein